MQAIHIERGDGQALAQNTEHVERQTVQNRVDLKPRTGFGITCSPRLWWRFLLTLLV